MCHYKETLLLVIHGATQIVKIDFNPGFDQMDHICHSSENLLSHPHQRTQIVIITIKLVKCQSKAIQGQKRGTCRN